MSGTVSYHHHVHSLDSSDLYIETDTPVITTDGLLDDYMSDTPVGCFTTPYYHIRYSYKEWVAVQRPAGTDTDGIAGNEFETRWEERTRTRDYWTTDEADHAGNRIGMGYVKSCAYTRGEIMKAVITYSGSSAE